MRKLFTLLLCASAFLLSGAELLTDGGFEIPGDANAAPSAVLKEWIGVLGNGYPHSQLQLLKEKEAFKGKYSLLLISDSKKFWTGVQSKHPISVQPGQKITASVWAKGSGNVHLHFYYVDKMGKRIKFSSGDGTGATPQWKKFIARTTVPEDAAGLILTVSTLRNGRVAFDEAEVEIEAGPILRNDVLTATLDPNCGGVIDSLKLTGNSFDYTFPNGRGRFGGLCADIIPSDEMPGVLRNEPSEMKVLKPFSRISFTSAVDRGPLNGMRLIKEYMLEPGRSDEILVKLTFENPTDKPMKVSYRVQNIMNDSEGIFSWPHPDWVQIFRRQPGQSTWLNSITIPQIRAGWAARFYKMNSTTLLFGFNPIHVAKCYTYLANGMSTMEWYFRPFELMKGNPYTISYSVKVLTGQSNFYTDAMGEKQKVEEILPVTMPQAEMKEPLPAKIHGFFPYLASTGMTVPVPAVAGKICGSSSEYFRRMAELHLDDLADANFNSVYCPLMAEEWQEALWNDGKNLLGEQCRELRMKFIPSRIYIDKAHVDRKAFLPVMKKMLASFENGTNEMARFAKAYPDLVPAVFIADEITGKNADCMVAFQKAIKSYLPEGVQAFPYLNISTHELIPYVPVFFGDWYPIQGIAQSGRNPWSMYEQVKAAVDKAGMTPVWALVQGFGGGIYRLPTSGELALMLNLAVAAGAKGIAYHGVPNVGWSWVAKSYYNFSCLGVAGQKTREWEVVSSCGREFTAMGKVLTESTPCELPKGFSVTSEAYIAPHNFYRDNAVKAYALKHPDGFILICVNNNPTKESSCNITFPAGSKIWDLNLMKPLEEGDKLVLPPGGARYYFSGNYEKILHSIWKARFERAAVRYFLLANQAKNAGIPVTETTLFEKLSPEKGYAELSKAFAGLEKRIASHELGRLRTDLSAVSALLDEMDFLLECSLDVLITPEMEAGTRVRGIYQRHPDPSLAQVKENALADFREYNQIRHQLRSGAKIPELRDSAAMLKEKVASDLASARKAISIARKRMGTKATDPYDEE